MYMVPGPDHELFESQFFELVSKALRPGGVLCIQAESIWFQSLDIEELLTKLSKAPLMHGQLSLHIQGKLHSIILCQIYIWIKFLINTYKKRKYKSTTNKINLFL